MDDREREFQDNGAKLDPLILRLEAELSELGYTGTLIIQGRSSTDPPKDAEHAPQIITPIRIRRLNKEAYYDTVRFDRAATYEAIEKGKPQRSPLLVALDMLTNDNSLANATISAQAIEILEDPAILMGFTIAKVLQGNPSVPDALKKRGDSVLKLIASALGWLEEEGMGEAIPERWKGMIDEAKKQAGIEPSQGGKHGVNAHAFEEVKDEAGNVVGFRGPDGEMFAFADHEQGDEHGNQ